MPHMHKERLQLQGSKLWTGPDCLQERCAEINREGSALQAQHDQLSSILAATPKPAHSRKAAMKLKTAEDNVEIVTSIQVGQANGSAVKPAADLEVIHIRQP